MDESSLVGAARAVLRSSQQERLGAGADHRDPAPDYYLIKIRGY
eukprot:SAG31_NODE_3628_length_4050_cov_2.582890_1_plen_44_part_00